MKATEAFDADSATSNRELLRLVFIYSCIHNPSRKLFHKWSGQVSPSVNVEVPVNHQRVGFKRRF